MNDKPNNRKHDRVIGCTVALLALVTFAWSWNAMTAAGRLAGYDNVHPLPGIADGLVVDSAWVIPFSVDVLLALTLATWLAPATPERARRFAYWTALGAMGVLSAVPSLVNLAAADGVHRAPWPAVALLTCIPVAVLGMGAALAHMLHAKKES